MKVFKSLTEVEKNQETVLTLGTFDGIHLGHKKIIEGVVEKASQTGGRSFIITFDPHPRTIVSKSGVKLLNTLSEKLEIINGLGIENVLVINFTKEFSQLESETFIKNYIVDKVGLREIVIGYDHHFGKGRGGDERTLRELGVRYGFGVTKVDAVFVEGISVSSTKIRNALINGEVQLASSYLGNYYSFSGTVIRGDGRGRTLGFPTANIRLGDENKLLPAIGIYAVEVLIGHKKYYALLSIGRRPTFYIDGNVTTEIYILDFDSDIYGSEVTVNMIERIRGEEKFSTAEQLIVQMQKDKEAGLEIFSKHSYKAGKLANGIFNN